MIKKKKCKACGFKFRLEKENIDLAIINERTGSTVYKMRRNGQKLVENEPKPKINEIICLSCKKPIQGNIGKNGVSYSPREIYNMTKGLCTDCYKQLKAMNGGKQ